MSTATLPAPATATRFHFGDVLTDDVLGPWVHAEDRETGDQVTIRVVEERVGLLSDAVMEARAGIESCHALDHPGVCAPLECVRDGRRWLFVYPRLAGRTLADVCASSAARVLDPGQLWPLAEQICDAMACAHDQRLVHGGIRPENIFVDGEGTVRLVDFGLGTILTRAVLRTGESEMLRSLVPFLSGTACDLRGPYVTDDVFSLGAVLYVALGANVPWAPTKAHWWSKPKPAQALVLVNDLRARLRPRAAPIPAAWEHTIVRCLDRDGFARPRGTRVIADALGSAFPSHQRRASTVPKSDASSARRPLPAPLLPPSASAITKPTEEAAPTPKPEAHAAEIDTAVTVPFRAEPPVPARPTPPAPSPEVFHPPAPAAAPEKSPSPPSVPKTKTSEIGSAPAADVEAQSPSDREPPPTATPPPSVVRDTRPETESSHPMLDDVFWSEDPLVRTRAPRSTGRPTPHADPRPTPAHAHAPASQSVASPRENATNVARRSPPSSRSVPSANESSSVGRVLGALLLIGVLALASYFAAIEYRRFLDTPVRPASEPAPPTPARGTAPVTAIETTVAAPRREPDPTPTAPAASLVTGVPASNGLVTVTTFPVDALVQIGDRSPRPGPVVAQSLPPGPTSIRTTAEGHHPSTVEIDVQAGQTTNLDVRLERIAGAPSVPEPSPPPRPSETTRSETNVGASPPVPPSDPAPADPEEPDASAKEARPPESAPAPAPDPPVSAIESLAIATDGLDRPQDAVSSPELPAPATPAPASAPEGAMPEPQSPPPQHPSPAPASVETITQNSAPEQLPTTDVVAGADAGAAVTPTRGVEPEPRGAPEAETPAVSPPADSFARIVDTGRLYALSEVDVHPTVLQRTEPETPARFRRVDGVGSVRLAVVIDRSGFVSSLAVDSSTDARLTSACIAAVRTWRFTPATIAGEPVAVRAVLPFVFHPTPRR
jgi:serine/threonine-protein kinase